MIGKRVWSRPVVWESRGPPSSDMADAFAYMAMGRTFATGFDRSSGDDLGTEADVMVHEDGRMEILAVRYTAPFPRPSVPRHTPAGLKPMINLMQRARDRETYGGAI